VIFFTAFGTRSPVPQVSKRDFHGFDALYNKKSARIRKNER